MPKSAILQHLDIYMQVWCAEAPFLLHQHVSWIKGEETKKWKKRRPSHQAKSEEKDPCCCVVLQRIISLFIGNATRTKSEGLEEERLGQQTIKAEKKVVEAALKYKKAEKGGICPCSKEGKQGCRTSGTQAPPLRDAWVALLSSREDLTPGGNGQAARQATSPEGLVGLRRIIPLGHFPGRHLPGGGVPGRRFPP